MSTPEITPAEITALALVEDMEENDIDSSRLNPIILARYGLVVALPEQLQTRKRATLLERANLFVGKVMMSPISLSRRQNQEVRMSPDDEERYWNSIMGH